LLADKDAEDIKKELLDYVDEYSMRIMNGIKTTINKNYKELKKLISDQNSQIDFLTRRNEELERTESKLKDEILQLKGEMKYIQAELEKNHGNSSVIAEKNTKDVQNVITKDRTEENIKIFNIGKIDTRFLKTKLIYNSGDKVMEELNADDKNKFFYRVNSSDGYFDVFPIENLDNKNLRYLESFFDIETKNSGKIEVRKACRIASTSYGYYYFVSKGSLIV